MIRCVEAQADLLLDGVAYQFESAREAAEVHARLFPLSGAVFTRRCPQRWGPHLPATAPRTPPPQFRNFAAEREARHAPPPPRWGPVGRATEDVRLPAEEDEA